MAHIDHGALRLELLRARAAIERAELRAAVVDLRVSTAPVRSLFGLVSSRPHAGASASAGIGALVRAIVGVLRDRPWLLSAAATVASRRGVRRWLVLGAVAMLVAVVVRRAVTLVQTAPPRDGASGARAR